MKHYRKFFGLFDQGTWLEPAYIATNGKGEIIYLSDQPMAGKEVEETIDGWVIPGFQNAHSHAFQYAMAGLTERHLTKDDFWSWREKMYQLALTLDPDQMEAVATMLYAEMLRHGYTEVAEFHYLHHDQSGKPYHHLAEMGERLVAAAGKAGIRITLVPVFYRRGGFGMPPTEGQKRFICAELDDYVKLIEASQKVVEKASWASLGVGVHSLRAVTPEDVIRTVQEFSGHLPFHLHISEQKKEVADALAFYNQRPVEWLLDHVEISERFHLVHATHLTPEEVKGIATSGANVVLCPSTEGNLGDGRFSLQEFQQAGGNWSIGTDSHIGLSPMEELRILDYGQRIYAHQRNIFHSSDEPDSGVYGLNKQWKAGRMAMGKSSQTSFALGEAFDAVVIDGTQPLIATSSSENRISTFIYAGDPSFIKGTI
ncbi:MAG: formimidoylglutamate deiminase, partial [Bacteroidetes bacterium]|nr:formimidoylglutamate deiminase [Bacteroidota bacterium]